MGFILLLIATCRYCVETDNKCTRLCCPHEDSPPPSPHQQRDTLEIPSHYRSIEMAPSSEYGPTILENAIDIYLHETRRGSRSPCRTPSPVNRSPNRSPSPRMTIPGDQSSPFDPPSHHGHQIPEAPPPSYQDVIMGDYNVSPGHGNLDHPKGHPESHDGP